MQLESHLRRVALSLDWMKPLDSTLTVGSGSYILPRPMPIYPRQGGGKKTTRKNYSESKKNPDLEFYYLSSFRSKTDAYWWRGGRLSRQVFSWNMLPRSLASKGGRQGLKFSLSSIKFSGVFDFCLTFCSFVLVRSMYLSILHL